MSICTAIAAGTLSQAEKISSLTLKTFGPEVTVCYPVKRNKCMSDLEKCRELNCIKALSLPELQSNWIKLEKQLPMCTNPFFFPFPNSSFFGGGETLWDVLFQPIFCPCQHSPNEIPKIRRWGEHACSSAQSKHCQTDTPLTPARRLASLSFPVLIKIPYWDSSLPLRLPGPVTQPPTGDKISKFQQRHTRMHRDTQSKLFLRQLVPAPALYVWDESFL